MRVARATALFTVLLGIPAAAAAAPSAGAKIPDLSGFPISEHRRIPAEELAERVKNLPLPAEPARVHRLELPASVRVVDDVALFEVESCASEPDGSDSEPTCAVYHARNVGGGGGQAIPIYDYTWSTTVLGRQLLGTFGDETTTYLLFNQYPTDDFGGGFYMPIYSGVEGIGTDRHDLRTWFGSRAGGALRGIVSMNMWWSCDWGDWFQDGCTDEAPFATTFRSLHGVLGQEVGHEWGVFLRYLTDQNRGSPKMLGRDQSHWSYWFNSGGSPLEGNHWIDKGGGKFELEHAPYTKYADFDLYAMGLMAPEEVQPSFYIEPENCTSNECASGTPPESGRHSVTGRRVDVGIEHVIATMGDRFPAFEEAPRFHRQLFIFTRLTSDWNEGVTQQAMEKLGRVRRFWNEYFYEATRTRMRAITTVSGRDDYPRFEFTIGDEGWMAVGSTTPATSVDGRLEVRANGAGPVGVRNDNVQVDTSRHVSVVVRVAVPESAAGKKIRLTFGGTNGVLDTANAIEIAAPVADGVARSYGANLAGRPGWTGTIGSLQVELVDAAAGEALAIDRLELRGEAWADADGDLLLDTEDNCPSIANEDQADSDGDGVGDVCQDSDGDRIIDSADNCPAISNANQADADGDGIGDACEDTDGDGVLDLLDNCPMASNANQADTDGDGIGDVCEDFVDGKKGRKKKDDGGCSSAAALPSAAGLILAGLALARRRR